MISVLLFWGCAVVLSLLLYCVFVLFLLLCCGVLFFVLCFLFNFDASGQQPSMLSLCLFVCYCVVAFFCCFYVFVFSCVFVLGCIVGCVVVCSLFLLPLFVFVFRCCAVVMFVLLF